MSRATTVVPYILPSHPGLAFGFRIKPKFPMSSDTYLDYHPTHGVYRARELVALSSPLLDTIVLRLGQDKDGEEPARDVLLNGLAASLAISGRESTLPLVHYDVGSAREAVARQAQKIGKSIVEYAREASDPDKNGQRDLQLYSQCEGHLWMPAVASLLLGPRSNGSLMAFYNEWLHRSILLRDALLPFENYEDVALIMPSSHDKPSKLRGIRAVEEPRKLFLLECLAGRQIRQSALVNLAKVFTAPQLPEGGYGLQYAQGLILPAFLSGSPSAHLLRHHPACIDDSIQDVLFDYEEDVYEQAVKTNLPITNGVRQELISPGSWPIPSLIAIDPRVVRSSIDVSKSTLASRRVLKLEIVLERLNSVSVDLGQIARGHRYAYRAVNGVSDTKLGTTNTSVATEALRKEQKNESRVLTSTQSEGLFCVRPDESPPPPPYMAVAPTTHFNSAPLSIYVHETSSALDLPGLLTSNTSSDNKTYKGGIHVFPASHPLVSLALLGKLYPSNVVLLDSEQRLEDALSLGKGFGAKFVILRSKNGYKV